MSASRLRTLVGTMTMLAFSLALAGSVPALQVVALDWALLPLLCAAAFHLGGLGERLPSTALGAEQARRENDELRALLDITETIGRTLEPREVMHTIARLVGEYVGTDSCSIVRADPQRGCLEVVASKGHPEADSLELALEDYPEIRRAIETRQPVVVDVTTDPLVEPAREMLLEQGYRSTLVLPLLYGEEVLGTLFVRTRQDRPFGRETLHFCQVAAGASANSLKNALLFKQVSRESERNRATGEKLRRVLDATPDMIVATDDAGRITECNRGASRLIGRGVQELVGQEIAGLLEDDLEVPDVGAPDAEPRAVSFRRASDGENIELSLIGAPIHDADDRATGRVWIGRDVTRLRRVEKSLAQAERLSSLGEVVAGVAHELNNPLSGVVGYAELLRVNATDDAQIRDLDRIVESALRCQKIVLKLLSFARKHKPEKRYQNVNDCVMKVLDLKGYHLKSSQVTTELQLDEQLPSTSFDFHQLEQVILNLLNNAEHALASLRRPGRIVVATGVEEGSVFVRVTDDGPGVPSSVRDRVFDPFFTTKELGMGTGLGLSVSYGIVEEHGGRLELDENVDGEGACFTIRLPLVDEADVASQAALEPLEELAARPLGGCRILVAEDEEMILELLSRVLEDAGAEVTLTRDGEEAWTRLEQREFDLIVADLCMPRLSGQGLYQRATEERPDLLRRFVFATGDLAREETMEFLEQLPNRILYKPLEVETLRRVLGQAMEGAAQTG